MQRRLEKSIKHAVILAYSDQAFIGGKLPMIGMVNQVMYYRKLEEPAMVA